MPDTVLVAHDGPVAIVTLHRPEKLNALDETLLTELDAVLAALDNDGTVRCAVLTGSGEKAFAAGADIAAMAEMPPERAKRFSELGHRVCARLEGARFPVIGAINGFALGGGCEIALACDFLHASEKARFGQPEVSLGVIPGFGGTQRLARRVGLAKARELCFTGDMVSADEALRIGLVNAVHPQVDLVPKVVEIAKKIAQKGPLAITACKRVLLDGADVPLPRACAMETEAFAGLFSSADQREGMAAFLAKRPAKFEGR
jgi:enoyl-CoA hydratase